ncbi:MAG: hypothetical protein RLP44_18145 [Aggregatilineales bacterium]
MDNVDSQTSSTFKMMREQGIGLVATVLLVVGLFLPFVSALGFSVNYIETDDGKIVLAIAVFSAILFFLKRFAFAGIGGFVALGIAGYDVYQALPTRNQFITVDLELGAFIICFSAFGMVCVGLVGVIMKTRQRQLQPI